MPSGGAVEPPTSSTPELGDGRDALPAGDAPQGPPPEPRPPTQESRRPRLGLWLALSAGAAVVALLLALGWLVMVYPDRRGPGDGTVRALELQSGASLGAVAGLLAERGLIDDAESFERYAHVRGAATRLRSGRVLVRDSMTPRELLARIAIGYGAVQLRIVFPEGFTRFQTAERLGLWGVCDPDAWLRLTEDAAVLKALGIDAPNAEGWIFPDTYQLMSDSPPRAVLQRMVGTAQRRYGPVFAAHGDALRRLKAELGWGRQQVLTLASIVEEEAVVPEERPIIAGVFLNRLRDPDFRPKRLQADPTVSYGCLAVPGLASCADFDGRTITRNMLAGTDNPYNTYRHEGLPPGPIGNPGRASLEAVLAPAEHDYLYFVARGGGRHSFSATLEEHNAAVQRFRAGP